MVVFIIIFLYVSLTPSIFPQVEANSLFHHLLDGTKDVLRHRRYFPWLDRRHRSHEDRKLEAIVTVIPNVVFVFRARKDCLGGKIKQMKATVHFLFILCIFTVFDDTNICILFSFVQDSRQDFFATGANVFAFLCKIVWFNVKWYEKYSCL